VRALEKAGYSTLASLRDASLEALSAVPGMSEIKARSIRDFLAQFAALPDPEPEPATPPLPDPALRLQTTAAQAMGRVIELLVSGVEAGLRPRLLRELTRFAAHAETLVAEAPRLSAKDRERSERRLQRASELLSSAWTHNDLDKKAQARLADGLAEVTDKLTVSE
jgi:hypothetical protein